MHFWVQKPQVSDAFSRCHVNNVEWAGIEHVCRRHEQMRWLSVCRACSRLDVWSVYPPTGRFWGWVGNIGEKMRCSGCCCWGRAASALSGAYGAFKIAKLCQNIWSLLYTLPFKLLKCVVLLSNQSWSALLNPYLPRSGTKPHWLMLTPAINMPSRSPPQETPSQKRGSRVRDLNFIFSWKQNLCQEFLKDGQLNRDVFIHS